MFDLFFIVGLVRIFTSRTHHNFADRNTHVVWVPYNRNDPAELPLKQRDWLLMA
ncbi:hypothetical protein SAMN05661080_02577 [Modestobacter sp. DSM 44400]|uniref:hypothetical protein n=1 Tax=Modestobacter sp. DSM 44400 TaxID=1550230 RepID=UPI000899CE46|nr:hypothetical protein [Modestobacter sp. DSM 44400]SDY17735.1 hypothetical protein SAMN05661080_02577 [Modestobacter sp. DSM 44400]